LEWREGGGTLIFRQKTIGCTFEAEFITFTNGAFKKDSDRIRELFNTRVSKGFQGIIMVCLVTNLESFEGVGIRVDGGLHVLKI